MSRENIMVLQVVVLALLLYLVCNSCTISFQNIATHGTATDLVDETQSNEPNVSPDISVPVSLTP